jgi:hypothetical protein
LVASWIPYLDNKAYDPAELKHAMQGLPAWRLFGASLATDFKTMTSVLRGKIPAGQLINGYNGPQAKSFYSPLNDLGQTTSQLVFTPIAPCRMVDTRNAGARTGILVPNVARTFDLTTGGYSKGQGGATSGCTGLPADSPYGWSVNITVAAYTGDGGLQAYPYLGAQPATSIINYFTAAYAIANNGAVTGCYLCLEDVTINAFGVPTHVIIDVMGYYDVATGFATGTFTRTALAGTSTSVAANGFTFITGGACPAGTVLIGGGQTNSSSGQILTSDHYISGTTWYEYVKNLSTTTAYTVTIYSICADVS